MKEMERVTISESVMAIVTTTDPWNWVQHKDDTGRVKFIAYIAGNNYSKLDSLAKELGNCLRRPAKQFKGRFTYELKVRGCSWKKLMMIAKDTPGFQYLDLPVAPKFKGRNVRENMLCDCCGLRKADVFTKNRLMCYICIDEEMEEKREKPKCVFTDNPKESILENQMSSLIDCIQPHQIALILKLIGVEVDNVTKVNLPSFVESLINCGITPDQIRKAINEKSVTV